MVNEIQTHSNSIIEHCYREFLLNNHDPEDREYPEAADQIREVLIHENYLSKRDIDICLGYDVSALIAHEHHSKMEDLHRALDTEYLENE